MKWPTIGRLFGYPPSDYPPEELGKMSSSLMSGHNPTATEVTMKQQDMYNRMAQHQIQVAHSHILTGAMNSAIGTQAMPGPFPVENPKITTIRIEEASNGHIIRLGGTTRVCMDVKELAEAIAALYAEERMK